MDQRKVTEDKGRPGPAAENSVRSWHSLKDKGTRTKPLRHDLEAPQDKNKKSLNDLPKVSLTSLFSS